MVMVEVAPRGWLRLFSHPLVGLLGSVASVVGLALAIYFYSAARAEPLLTVVVNPVRTPIVQVGGVSNLAVLFSGRRVQGDVTATQIAIWNDGKEPVRESDVLAPVTIRLGAPILELSIRKVTRKVCGIHVTSTSLPGVVAVSWNVLEYGDGAVIQLIYAGSPRVPIDATGTIIGQRSIVVHTTNNNSDTDPNDFRTTSQILKIASYIMVALGFVMLTTSAVRFVRSDRTLHLVSVLLRIGVPLSYIGIGILIMHRITVFEPPFGF